MMAAVRAFFGLSRAGGQQRPAAPTAADLRSMAEMGITADMLQPPDAADADADTPPGQPVELWPCFVQAFSLFMALHTQWRTGGLGGRVGLDYTAVPLVASMQGLSRRALRACWPDLIAMERAALQAFATPAGSPATVIPSTTSAPHTLP